MAVETIEKAVEDRQRTKHWTRPAHWSLRFAEKQTGEEKPLLKRAARPSDAAVAVFLWLVITSQVWIHFGRGWGVTAGVVVGLIALATLGSLWRSEDEGEW